MKNGKVIRVDEDFDKMVKEIAELNDMSLRQVTKELAKQYKLKTLGKNKILKEIKF